MSILNLISAQNGCAQWFFGASSSHTMQGKSVFDRFSRIHKRRPAMRSQLMHAFI